MSHLHPSVLTNDSRSKLECCKSTIILREKVIIIGDATVGKTALVHANLNKNKIRKNTIIDYSNDYSMTMFPELNVIEISNTNNNDTTTDAMVDLFVYDIPGQIIMKQVSAIAMHKYVIS